jgi:hypothetical protein
MLKLINRADGVNGHYCFGKQHTDGYWEFWNNAVNEWCSAGTVFQQDSILSVEKHEADLQEKQVELLREILDNVEFVALKNGVLVDTIRDIVQDKINKLEGK